MPEDQVLRIKGEQLLSEPDRYLPQIAEWLGVSTDASVIAAMKHPERSPFACVGPTPAHSGHDGKFMRSPTLRAEPVPEPSLEHMLSENPISWLSSQGHQLLAKARLEMVEDHAIMSEVRGLTQRLGYQ